VKWNSRKKSLIQEESNWQFKSSNNSISERRDDDEEVEHLEEIRPPQLCQSEVKELFQVEGM
jgi:hypothetical protein